MNGKRVLIVLLLALVANLQTGGVGASITAERCVFAPSPRLHPGMSALVIADGLNLRALSAVDTGVNGRLYGGNLLTVLSGPSCNGHINWWRVETGSGVRGWVAEGTWLDFYLIPAGRETGRQPTPTEWTCGIPFRARLCYTAE